MKSVLIFSAFALLLLTAAGSGARPQRHDTIEETLNFARETTSKSYDFVTEPSTSTARLRVVVKLTTGRAEWKLLSPNGDVHLSGVCAGGRVISDTGDFKPSAAGDWRLQIELHDASGDYRVNWKSRQTTEVK